MIWPNTDELSSTQKWMKSMNCCLDPRSIIKLKYSQCNVYVSPVCNIDRRVSIEAFVNVSFHADCGAKLWVAVWVGVIKRASWKVQKLWQWERNAVCRPLIWWTRSVVADVCEYAGAKSLTGHDTNSQVQVHAVSPSVKASGAQARRIRKLSIRRCEWTSAIVCVNEMKL